MSRDGRPPKRPKLVHEDSEIESERSIASDSETDSEQDIPVTSQETTQRLRVEKSISPPPLLKRTNSIPQNEGRSNVNFTPSQERPSIQCIPSQVQLTRVNSLGQSANAGSISLHDLLGDPLIESCWQFNFLIDIDFIMRHFDSDTRNLVNVKVVHGSWKKEDPQRFRLEEACQRWPNLQVIPAYMPEMFGTHHTKAMVLFRHDNTAQVIIHTANMIEQDWTNMTQAVWRSPLLPLLSSDTKSDSSSKRIGSGERFKADLLHYFKAYSNRLDALVSQLELHDFGGIRAAIVSSVPSKQRTSASSSRTTAFGWLGLKQVLSTISTQANHLTPQVNIQVSSIATLTEAWLKEFFQVLSTKASSDPQSSFFGKPVAKKANTQSPVIKLIFPTAAEIRNSLDGYHSGGSIHMKLQSAAQIKQLAFMKPFLHHWDGGHDRPISSAVSIQPSLRTAGRRLAAPHIKTFIRFTDAFCTEIDWAMVTSANLSTQAWGALPNKEGEVRICSYELGVVVWPELFADGEDEDVVMVPTFGTDMPSGLESGSSIDRQEDTSPDGADGKEVEGVRRKKKVIGFRMPYDLPLVRYGQEDVPWCATAKHTIPDRHGQVWGGYEPKA